MNHLCCLHSHTAPSRQLLSLRIRLFFNSKGRPTPLVPFLQSSGHLCPDHVGVEDGSCLRTIFCSELGGRADKSPACASLALSGSAQDQSKRSFFYSSCLASFFSCWLYDIHLQINTAFLFMNAVRCGFLMECPK